MTARCAGLTGEHACDRAPASAAAASTQSSAFLRLVRWTYSNVVVFGPVVTIELLPLTLPPAPPCSGILFVGYALFEVPSNLLLARVGARWWIARIMFTWGVIAVAMALVRAPIQFYVLRFVLGVAEAGFFPGVVYYLSQWFPSDVRARASARFMVAIPLAGVLSGAIGGSLLGLDGRLGLAGWQWLFVAEGLPSIGASWHPAAAHTRGSHGLARSASLLRVRSGVLRVPVLGTDDHPRRAAHERHRNQFRERSGCSRHGNRDARERRALRPHKRENRACGVRCIGGDARLPRCGAVAVASREGPRDCARADRSPDVSGAVLVSPAHALPRHRDGGRHRARQLHPESRRFPRAQHHRRPTSSASRRRSPAARRARSWCSRRSAFSRRPACWCCVVTRRFARRQESVRSSLRRLRAPVSDLPSHRALPIRHHPASRWSAHRQPSAARDISKAARVHSTDSVPWPRSHHPQHRPARADAAP